MPSGDSADPLHQALALHRARRLAEAEAAYRGILAEQPQQFDALHLLGVLHAERGDVEGAIALLKRALAVNPQSAAAHANLAEALRLAGRLAEAAGSYARAVALKPSDVLAHKNLGETLFRLGRVEEALAAYERAIARFPDSIELHNGRAILLAELDRSEEAVAELRRIVALNPALAEVHCNLGLALSRLGQFEPALAAFGEALRCRPDFANAYYSRSHALRELGRFAEAREDTEKALRCEPDLGMALGRIYYEDACRCDWKDRPVRLKDLRRVSEAGRRIVPFPLLSAFDEPELHLKAARVVAGPARREHFMGGPRTHRRLRLAYISPDFRDHPVAWQAVELFERHDKTRFETYGICVNATPDTPARLRLKAAFEHFHEAGSLSDRALAQLLGDLDIDIAVDLAGHTEKSRIQALSCRPVPVTALYLGYPGTSGADYVDYVVADASVIPHGCEGHYSEKVVRLPHSFFPLDTRHRREACPSRAEAGLPERGFVFTSFNNTFKITPEMFDVWMRLLKAVAGSVLWLRSVPAAVEDNLRAEAGAHGVPPERLIFAPMVERAAHLARVGVADLLLDTMPYGGHTTASDALYAGVPVVACTGRSFASRVAASMLNVLGLEELAVSDLAAYEALALALARTPDRLAALRDKLLRARADSVLFDMAGLCRDLERAYGMMWERHLGGLPPDHIDVRA